MILLNRKSESQKCLPFFLKNSSNNESITKMLLVIFMFAESLFNELFVSALGYIMKI